MHDSHSSCIILTDNGSLRPDATLSLRFLASKLEEKTGETIHPVSLLHSNKVAPSQLRGIPADIFEPFVLARREMGIQQFIVLPLFFGPSAAIAEYLPQRVDALKKDKAWPELSVRVAPCLVDPSAPEDFRLAEMLTDAIGARIPDFGGESVSVALVDHGSPRRAVTEVRNFVASQVEHLLGDRVKSVRPCSMERREDAKYNFNEPLLERLLGQDNFDRDVIVSMLFLQPGRHAGEGGDVARICQAAEQRIPGLRTRRTELVGSHAALLGLLAERLWTVLEVRPLVAPA